MKKVLILSFYYTPDLCAGSFRAAAFVKAMEAAADVGVEFEVLSTMPNRYNSFDSEAAEIEQHDRTTIRRFPIKSHKSGFVDQSLSFGSYARQVLRQTKGKKYDLVFATSSRLMTAALGALVVRRQTAPLYLDIRDIFTDTLNDVLSTPVKLLVLPFFRQLERYTFRSATTINLVSPGFANYFRIYGDKYALRFFTNGIDPEFFDYDFSVGAEVGDRKSILFAGNIGEGQGMEKIIPQTASLLPDEFELVVIGDGGTKNRLVEACQGRENVKLLGPVNREELKQHYANADILFMHLNDYEAFKKVLPSKIFEYAATGKPILAGVAGYAAEFTENNVENAIVFEPCDAQAMVDGVIRLDLSLISRDDFKNKFSRMNIMRDMAVDVLSFLNSP